ncbi:MAG: orotidine-5'-phosphate decarboxylase [Planctomycetaceae bacterium]|nr:orotidine-5'-phosphate decarboxylase [Planctomycetaceae bacterium]MCB9950472.1 orotidine-5'-phosphate decarboxylase [Planctomycetaceae bacterium]
MMFSTRLHNAIVAKKTAALVGLDPRWGQLPKSLKAKAEAGGGPCYEIMARAFEEFCLRIIDVVADRIPAVKPQSAFFEELGPAGVHALQRVNKAARERGLIVICDAKRGDIGSTAEAYAKAYLAGEDPNAAPFAADALTVNPYMGTDTLQPFVDRAQECGAGLYVLVRTSNPGSGEFQEVESKAGKVYQQVARAVEQISAAQEAGTGYGNVGAVVGATYPAELTELRQTMPHVPLLIPGYGSQGGNASDVAGGLDERGLGAIVNSSRGIIFAYQKGDFAHFGEERWEEAVSAATDAMREDLATHTAVSALQG